MQTHFTEAQLADPLIHEGDAILRKCVHCGFCTATCPTFVITGDERDSPRGRIWMLRELLESRQWYRPIPAIILTGVLAVCPVRRHARRVLITRIYWILAVRNWKSWCHASCLTG